MRLELVEIGNPDYTQPHYKKCEGDCPFWKAEWNICVFNISHFEPYVTRKSRKSIVCVTHQRGKYGYRVKCTKCNWRGYRRGYNDCECYEDWSMYCRPWSPGPGCPSGIDWPCPQCSGHGFDWW